MCFQIYYQSIDLSCKLLEYNLIYSFELFSVLYKYILRKIVNGQFCPYPFIQCSSTRQNFTVCDLVTLHFGLSPLKCNQTQNFIFRTHSVSFPHQNLLMILLRNHVHCSPVQTQITVFAVLNAPAPREAPLTTFGMFEHVISTRSLSQKI